MTSSRAASARRLLIALGILAAAIAAAWKLGGHTAEDRSGDFLPRWSAIDDGEMAEVWSCLFTKEVDVGLLSNAQQARRLIEAAYGGQKQGYPRHLADDCLARLARVQRMVGELTAPPPSERALAAYRTSLALLQDALRIYGQRLTARPGVKALDDAIIEHARAWYGAGGPPAVAYEKFLGCAVPSLQSLANDRALYEHLADRCFKADPMPFMERVRSTCVPLLRAPAGPPASTYQASRKKFRDADADAAQVQSWESCSDIARAQQRMADAAELLAATEAYLAARPVSSRSP
jgi:hypothetical protein